MAAGHSVDNPSDATLDRLARLGAESATERNVKRIVPWIISLAIHVGAILLALAITWTVVNLPRKDESVLIVADFNALNYEPVVGSGAATTDVTAPDVDVAIQPQPVSDRLSEQWSAAADDPFAEIAKQIGLAGSASGGALTRFAPQAGPNSASFAGLSGSNARRIVYVIDASGSMIAWLQIVIEELARSLSNLSPQQSFTVIFFQNNTAIELPPTGTLIAATPAERTKARQWIDEHVVASGGTNPLVGIQKALAHKPDVVFLLSQDITGYGQFEVDQQDLLAVLDTLNPVDAVSGRRMTQIKCIQFIAPDRLDTMKKIAEVHGGANGYRFLSREELGLGAP